VGSLKFYEREEIKDALALLSFLVNPRDEVAFRRVVNKPARGVGPVTVDKIVEASQEYNGDLAETARKMASGLAPKARSGLETFIKVIENGQSILNGAVADNGHKKIAEKKRRSSKKQESLAAGEGLSVCVTRLVKDSGIAEYHEEQDEITGNQRLNNLQELVNAASLYAASSEGLLEFLEHIELDRSLEDDAGYGVTEKSGNRANPVTLITFHNTKGLEFRRVIMTGLEQGVFPREGKKDEELEEERRLFYVGATRAMDELYLSSCAMRRMYGRTMPAEPSLFLREIDKNSVRITGGAPHGFAPSGEKGGPLRGSASKSSEVEEYAGWRRGERLFHDDHGYGEVMEVRDSDDGPVVRVRFETGKTLRFLSEHQGSAFVKIGQDC
jgi:DNA helicase-2/ATP-dependent DNA helicase PcrA